MDTAAKALLHGANTAFDFADVAVSGDDVESDWQEVASKAFEFVVGVYITDVKTARRIKFDDGSDFAEQSVFAAIVDEGDRPVSDTARDAVKKQ